MNEDDCLGFFAAQSEAFADTLAARRGRPDLIDGLLSQAFSSFEGNVAEETESHPPIACDKGCATCCTLRVTATAPEVLLIARYIRWTASQNSELGLADLLAKADRQTAGLDEAARVKLRRACPFIRRGACAIYQVRPLACRGHASYDRQACVDAFAGRADRVPISEPHRTFRGLIQNAMQSALRDAGYAWELYELNRAVMMALGDADSQAAWLVGEDVFFPAATGDVGREEMARTFDTLKLLA
ncbi:hypothetical protein BJL95_20545 [Methylomonas sp. LWB]|uniref:YkgJ family cysteine cluster protein n=1 Tax=Methylomonas sp. LWB TaxID=1905845 RepID=UPI0008D9BDCB|nr:YkgJ family cysteine cluster protein [Methylomonas sp. LWB]OHX37344.1 hypothetical protein BJL95_20545 [Methylomonas sp. LWB]